MAETNEPQEPKSRKGLILGILAIAAACGTLVMVHFSSSKAPAASDDTGFDIAGPAQAPQPEPSAPAPSAPQAQTQSGLGMVESGGIQLGMPEEAKSDQVKKARETFIEIARKNEGRVHALALAYEKKFPIVKAYGKEWMSRPDLKKLNDDYMKDHDPVKFIRGLAKAPSFGPMLRKYANQAPLQQFVMEVYTKAPSEATVAAQEVLGSEGKSVTTVVNSITSAVGLGPVLGSNLDDKLQKKNTLESATQSQSQLNP